MKKILLSFFILISSCTFLLSQPKDCDCYERLLNLTEYYYAVGDLEKSVEALALAIEKNKKNTTASDYLIMIQLLNETNQLDSIERVFFGAIERGLSHEELISNEFASIQNKIGTKRWNYILSQFPKYHLNYKSNLDIDYFGAIQFIKGADQGIRQTSLWETINLVKYDSISFSKIADLIEQKGFPTMDKHGIDGGIIEALFMHHSVYSYDRFLESKKILEQASEAGDFKKGFIAMLTDRYNIRTRTNPQVYGLWNLFTDRDKFTNLENVEDIDKRRFEYNLLRLKEQAKMENRKLPEGYKMLRYPAGYFCGFGFEE